MKVTYLELMVELEDELLHHIKKRFEKNRLKLIKQLFVDWYKPSALKPFSSAM